MPMSGPWSAIVRPPIVCIGTLLALQTLATPSVAKSSNLIDFARCLTRNGVTMYGASWCPVCKAQLEAFGGAAGHLRYVECSRAGTSVDTPACVSAHIKSFPTWEFHDRSRLKGMLSLSELSQKTGCPLPPDAAGKPSRRTPGTRKVPPSAPPVRLPHLDL
jgi:hypothetical protein